MSSITPWSDLPEELLGLVIARLFSPVDRARFQAVCRSWRSVVLNPRRQLPWIMLPYGFFLTPSDRVLHRLFSFPKTVSCIGSTDGWIAIDCPNAAEKRHKYLLHNTFSNTTRSLPELDEAIGDVSEDFKIRKVLMRSTPDDVVALMTNDQSCPIILSRPGKGAWLPTESRATPLFRIIDFAFLGERLYGITGAEDLVFLDISFDGDGKPMVTGGKCVIRGDGDGYDVWSDDGDEEEEDDGGHGDVEGDSDDEDDEDGSDAYELKKNTADDAILRVKDIITNMRYLVESRGKLLMVRRQLLWPKNEDYEFTLKVEVFEADMSAATWVPVTGLGGQAVFISTPFSRSVRARGEMRDDAIYFIDTDDVFDMRSRTVSAPRTDDSDFCYGVYLRGVHMEELTWVFPPELLA